MTEDREPIQCSGHGLCDPKPCPCLTCLCIDGWITTNAKSGVFCDGMRNGSEAPASTNGLAGSWGNTSFAHCTALVSNAFADLHVFLLEQFEKAVVSPRNVLLWSALFRQSDPLVDHPSEPVIHRSSRSFDTLILIHTHTHLENGWVHLTTQSSCSVIG